MTNATVTETVERPDRCIYVACLASYNAGILHGVWIDADQDPDDIQTEVDAMLAESKQDVAEDIAIHDHEGFEDSGLGEQDSFETVSRLAKLIVKHGDIANHVFNNFYSDLDSVETAFQDHYMGEHDSLLAWAYAHVEEFGLLEGCSELAIRYFNYKSFASDEESSGMTVYEVDRSVHVFSE